MGWEDFHHDQSTSAAALYISSFMVKFLLINGFFFIVLSFLGGVERVQLCTICGSICFGANHHEMWSSARLFELQYLARLRLRTWSYRRTNPLDQSILYIEEGSFAKRPAQHSIHKSVHYKATHNTMFSLEEVLSAPTHAFLRHITILVAFGSEAK